MPFIPTIVNKESAVVGAPASHATGPDFGSEIGAAMQNFGAQLKGLGSAFGGMGKEDQARADSLTVATGLAQNSFQKTQNDIEINYPDASGTGLPETVRDANLKFANDEYDTNLKGGMSKKNAETIKLARLRQVPGNVDQAANQATKMGAEHGVLSVQKGIDTLKNDIYLHGATSQKEVQDRLDNGAAMIDNMPGLSKTQKDEKKMNMANDFGHVRFDAMLRAAHSGADVLALKAELNTPYWKGLFKTPELERQVLQLDQSAKVWGEIGEDAHLNAIRASGGDQATYLRESKAGLDELNKVPSADPAEHAKDLQKYRSKAARAAVEARAEKLAYTATPENKAGLLQLRQDMKDPKLSNEMTQGDYEAQTNSIDSHLSYIDNELDKIQNKVDADLNKKIALRRGEYNVSLKHALEISKNATIPDEAWHELFAQRDQLGDAITPEERDDFHTIVINQDARGKIPPGTNQEGFDRAKRETLNNETRFRRTAGPGRAGEGGGGGLSYTAPNGVRVDSSIIDSTSVKGMQPRAYQILDGMVDAAPKAGIARLVITAAHGGGHKSHGAGTEWDMVGYTADGKRWSAEQRVAIAAGGRDSAGRADRFGLYEGGNGSLHIGYSGPGRPPATWGAGGLTGGDASRNFREPASRAFLAGGGGSGGGGDGGGPAMRPNPSQGMPDHVQGVAVGAPVPDTRVGARGGGGAGAGGGFYKALSGFEASNTNAPHSYATTSSGMARGYFQITDGTWKDFGGLATGYKTAYDAPYDVQKQIADKIPMARWAPETLNKMQKAGYVIYPTKTLAENAALNNDNGGGGPVGPANDIAPAGTDGSFAPGAPAGAAPLEQSVATGGVVAASDAVRQAAIIDAAATAQQSAINKDVMSVYEAGVGNPLPPLQASGEGWAQRVQDYSHAVDHYNATDKQRQPFKEAELGAYKDLMASTNTDGKLALYGNIEKFFPTQMQHEAFKQLATVDPFNAAVGRIMADGNVGMARSAMNGNALLEALPTGQKAVWQEDSDHSFIDVLGDSFRGMDPSIVGQKKATYDALYADQFGIRNKFQPDQYEKIIEHVENAKFDTVNGLRTLVPANTPAGLTERALSGIDYTAVSRTGTPILAIDPTFQGKGGLAPPSEWALRHAVLIRTGDNEYALADDKGQLFVTQLKDGSVVPYGALLGDKVITDAANKLTAAGPTRPTEDVGTPTTFGGYEPDTIPFVKPPEPQTGYTSPRAIPRAVETQLKSSLEVYRQSLIRGGQSEEYANQSGREFIDMMRQRWISNQGYKGQ